MSTEAKRAYQRAYYEKNKERIKKNVKNWYEANRERANANGRRWHEENKDHCREVRRVWYERNRDQVLANSRARTKALRFSQHGLTESDYLALLEAQDHVCAICLRECDVIDKLSIDHCHETGRVRGLLCKRCNSGLGFFRDSYVLLTRASEYLEAA